MSFFLKKEFVIKNFSVFIKLVIFKKNTCEILMSFSLTMMTINCSTGYYTQLLLVLVSHRFNPQRSWWVAFMFAFFSEILVETFKSNVTQTPMLYIIEIVYIWRKKIHIGEYMRVDDGFNSKIWGRIRKRRAVHNDSCVARRAPFFLYITSACVFFFLLLVK